MKYLFITLLLFSSSIFSSDAKVYFVNIKDGDKVQSPFLIQFGLSGKGVAPAGVDRKNTGHHHLLINVDSIDFNTSIPASDNHIHFGGGQTETVLDLLPGEYTLQLLSLIHI